MNAWIGHYVIREESPMTHKEEIRIRFSKTVEELDRLFALYGSAPSLFLDAKFIKEKAEQSIAINTMHELIKSNE